MKEKNQMFYIDQKSSVIISIVFLLLMSQHKKYTKKHVLILFNQSKKDIMQYDIKVSYVEIYNEVIRDLLVPNSKDTYLELRDDPIKGV